MKKNTATPINGTARRLDVQMSWWGMRGLGQEQDAWSLEQKFQHIAEAGFNGINGFLPAAEEAKEWNRLLDRYGLSFSVNAYPKSAQDLAQYLDKVKAYDGNVQFVNAQVLTPFLTDRPAEKLLHELDSMSREADIPVFIETHRGTITQDLLRTVQYVHSLDTLRLTIDFSHYVVAGEMHTVSEQAESLLQTLLTRTSSIHARVSNGEQVQVNVGDNGEHVMMPHFERWWQSGMSHWLKTAQNGDVFPFVCELGPPPYAITVDEYAGRKEEISNRWTQSLLFASIARSLWNEALTGS